MTLPYCTAGDIRRKLDLSSGKLDRETRQRYLQRAVAASQRWDQTTGTPMRTVRVGATDAVETWEYHDATHLSGHPPVHINLDHGSIVPIDSTDGDTIEIRTGRDSWDDVTTEQGDSWTLDNERGQLKLYRFLINRLRFERQSERFLRITYRHGGLGGDRNRGVNTTLDGSVDNSGTTLSVTSATRFPVAPFLILVGTTDELEYARVTGVDRANNDLTVSRGVRSTNALNHDSGDGIQYVPTDVREAVAAKAAELLALDDDAQLSIPDDGQLTDRTSRADRFRDEWEAACSQYSSVMTL